MPVNVAGSFVTFTARVPFIHRQPFCHDEHLSVGSERDLGASGTTKFA